MFDSIKIQDHTAPSKLVHSFSYLYLPGPPPVVLLLLLGEPVPSLPKLLAQFAEGEAGLLGLELGPLLLGEERERGELA